MNKLVRIIMPDKNPFREQLAKTLTSVNTCDSPEYMSEMFRWLQNRPFAHGRPQNIHII